MKITYIHAAVAVVVGLLCLGARCPREADTTPPVPPELQTEAADEGPRAEERRQMVEDIVRRHGLESEQVIRAMVRTRRHMFMPEKYRTEAYRQTPMPIGHGQTISAPGVVALMTELLQPDSDDVVLEVGTGSGYQAAVLAHLVKHVYTIEIIPELAETARDTLKELGYDNVTVKAGDGYRGWPEYAPFDGIIVTAAPTDVPEPLVQQLAEGGRMVIPVGEQWRAQQLYVMTRADGGLQKEAILPVQFVPMTGEAQDHTSRDIP